MHILIFIINNQYFAIELSKVIGNILAVEITQLPNAPDYLLGVIDIHGTLTPVINTRKLLNLPQKEVSIKDHFIICQIHEKQMAFWVDSIDQVKLCQKKELMTSEQIDSNLQAVQYAIKENNHVILVLDLEKLIPQNIA